MPDTPPALPAYAAAVASAAPTPGGGSVVAVVAALGAALGEMVCNLTIGRAADAEVEAELKAIVARLAALRSRLLGAAGEDEAAYRAYRAAAALPKGTESERAIRQAALQTALIGAADVPLAVAEACLRLAEALAPVARLGTRHALADAATGALLAEAALRGALLNVRGNADLIKDAAVAARYRRRADELETNGRAAAARVREIAASRGSG